MDYYSILDNSPSQAVPETAPPNLGPVNLGPTNPVPPRMELKKAAPAVREALCFPGEDGGKSLSQMAQRDLDATLQLLASEMAESAPGAEVMVNRLADILFIQCVRAHIASSSGSCKSGWLRAIFDPKIGAALKAMHERVENPWTVETLAAAAGMSRSAFALKFKELLGETPLEYLTNWRMYKAAGLLQGNDRKLFEVAKSVGYDSDAAFSKAFKRVLGAAPREYRRGAIEAL